MVLALAVPYLSADFQAQVAVTLQGTALAPFIALQERITEGRARADRIEYLQAELDSLVAVTSTQSALADENRELRDLLGLADRAGPRFLPATVLRPGTPGSESMFLVNVGASDGVREGAPIVTARGLVGRIIEVRERNAVGIDWTHPDFRASAMLAGGSMYGMVENRRGEFREDDRLMLNGTAYHERAPEGSIVVTSGLAGLLPRGIPIGRIDATAEVQGSWRKSYWLRPEVDPGGITHVLVETGAPQGDLTEIWAADTVPVIAPEPARRPPPRREPPPATRTEPAPSRPALPPPQPEAAAVQPPVTPTPEPSVPDSAPASPVEADSGAPTPVDSAAVPPPDSVPAPPADSVIPG
jgi:rod shape-determining protein MreC